MSLVIGMHMDGLGGSQATPEIGQHGVVFGGNARLDSGVFKFGDASLRLSLDQASFIDVIPKNVATPTEFFLSPGTPQFSISGWYRWSTDATDMTLFSYNDPSIADFKGESYRLRWDVSSTQLQLQINNNFSGLLSSVFGFAPTLDTFHYIQMIRNVNGISLTVDGSIKTTAAFSALQPIVFDALRFRIGNNKDGSEPFHGFVDDFVFLRDEVADITVPTVPFPPVDLPGANVVIVPSTLVTKGVEPDNEGDLWEPATFMLANWTERVVFREAFSTRISQPLTDAEKRTQLLDRPYRNMEIQLTSMAQAQTQALGNQINRWATARTLIPVYHDRTKLTAPAASGQPIISCDTVDRRFFLGQRVLVAGNQQRCELVDTEVVQILDITDTMLTFTSNLTNSFSTNALVYPLMEAKVMLSNDRTRVTGHVGVSTIEFLETEGRSAMPPLQDLDTIPAGVASYQDFPIFEWGFQRATEQIRRSGQELASGRATVTTTFGPRPKWGLSGGLRFKSRADYTKFVKFFHSRGGRTCPFWVASSFSEYELVEVNANNIKVAVVGEEIDWNFRPFFALVLFDGTIIIREIATVTRGGDGDVLGFTEAITATIGDVRRAARGALARFDNDELSQQYITQEHMDVVVSYIEILEEKAIDAGIEYLPTTAGEVCITRQDVECDDCVNSDIECDPLDDVPPNADGEGNPT